MMIQEQILRKWNDKEEGSYEKRVYSGGRGMDETPNRVYRDNVTSLGTDYMKFNVGVVVRDRVGTNP